MSLNTQSLQPIINFLLTVADDVLVNTYQRKIQRCYPAYGGYSRIRFIIGIEEKRKVY